jgi:hypothetical protein
LDSDDATARITCHEFSEPTSVVAISFEYRLHPVGPIVTGVMIAYPFSAAWDVLRFFRAVTASLADEFTVFAGLIHAPRNLHASAACNAQRQC